MSDRVVVLSGRPGRVVADIDVELERPRTQDDRAQPGIPGLCGLPARPAKGGGVSVIPSGGEAPASPRQDRSPDSRNQGGVNAVLRTFVEYLLPPLIAFALLIGAWEAYVAWKDVSVIVVPAPHRIAQRLYEDPWFFTREGGYTLYEATLGLVAGTAVALALAVAMTHWRPLERALMPLAIAIKVTPLVAIAPVLVIILGLRDDAEDRRRGAPLLLPDAGQRRRRLP